MKRLFSNFIDGFKLDEILKLSLIKLVIIVMFGPLYTGVFILIYLLLILNIWSNLLMKVSTEVLVRMFKEKEGKKRLVYMLFFGVILAPLIFVLYLVVIVIRTALYLLTTLYAIVFFIMTFINSLEIPNLMDETVKSIQKKDIF